MKTRMPTVSQTLKYEHDVIKTIAYPREDKGNPGKRERKKKKKWGGGQFTYLLFFPFMLKGETKKKAYLCRISMGIKWSLPFLRKKQKEG